MFCAEDMLLQQLRWCHEGMPPTTDEDAVAETCRRMHRKEGLSLHLKSPLLVRSLLGAGAFYDLLIDDSQKQDSCFHEFGLSPFLHRAEAFQPHGTVMHSLAQALGARFGVKPVANSVPIQLDVFYPYLRFEDLLYYPLLHIPGKLNEHAKALPGLSFTQ